MITIPQKIAIKWLTVIDSNQALFLLLKPLHLTLRVIFYTLLIGGTFLVSIFGLSLVELTRDVSLYLALIPTTGISFVLFYEAIFSLNLQDILQARKEQEKYIKALKLQKWRLRNMSFWVRIILYLFIYIILQQFIQIASIVAFFTSMQVPTQAQTMQFVHEFQILIKWFTVSYVAILGILEYFMAKRKAKQ